MVLTKLRRTARHESERGGERDTTESGSYNVVGNLGVSDDRQVVAGENIKGWLKKIAIG